MRCSPARVGGGDDGADGFLVEAFEAGVALQILEMAAKSAFSQKTLELPGRDQAGGKQPLETGATDRPAFPDSKGLAKKAEIRERFHGFDSSCLQLVLHQVELKTRFEMVHSGLEEALAMEADPEADGAEPGCRKQGDVGKIDLGFIGSEVYVGKDDDPGDRVFEDLCAPTRLGAGVIAFPLDEAQSEQEPD